MRIRWVKAIAFGGLVDQTLTLHEGLNVVVGPNESGKSTWHAALYAALCGRTEELEAGEDSEFDRRPWHGSGWAVEATLERDSDHPVLLYQDLLNPGSSTATELSGPADGGRHDVSADVRYHGGLDTAAWVGLDRHSYAATAWVQQSSGRNELSEAVSLCIREEDAVRACARIGRLRGRQIGDEDDPASPLGRADRAVHDRTAELREVRDLTEQHADALAVFGQWSAYAHTKGHELAVAELAAAQESVIDLQTRLRQQEHDPFAKPYGSGLVNDDGHDAVVAAERELRAAEEALAAANLMAARSAVNRPVSPSFAAPSIAVAVAHVPDDDLMEPVAGRPASIEFAPSTYDTRHHDRSTVVVTPGSVTPGSITAVARPLRGGRWRALRQPDGRALVFGIAAVLVVAFGVGLAALVGSVTIGAVLAAIGVGLAVIAVFFGLRTPPPEPLEFTVTPVSPAVVPSMVTVEHETFNPDPYVPESFYSGSEQSTVEFSDRLDEARIRVLSALNYVGHLADLNTVDSALERYYAERDRHRREELERQARDDAARGRLHEQLAEAQEEVTRLSQLIDPNMARPATVPALAPARTAHASAERERDRAAHTRDTTAAALASRPSVPAAEAALDEARQRLQSLRKLDNLLDEAYGYLSRSRIGARREIASALETSLGRSLPHITDGRYPHVSVGTDFRIRISDPAQPALDPMRGARSTREQTYLSARVALGEQLSRRRLYGPLLLDDVTSSADQPRVHGLLDLLYRFAQVRQVVVFAHEETVAEWAVGMIGTHPNVHLIRLCAVDQAPREVSSEAALD